MHNKPKMTYVKEQLPLRMGSGNRETFAFWVSFEFFYNEAILFAIKK